MLHKAIEQVSSTAKICLFIDGLDEVEGDNESLHEFDDLGEDSV